MKIIIAILVPILLGIVVGSNLTPVITVVIFNQPTIALPIGVWLLIAIGAGLLSSSLIQVAIYVDRRGSKRQIRQLQSRLQQSDEDFFTYTSSVPEPEQPPSDQPDRSQSKTSRFSSFKFGKPNTSQTKSTSEFNSIPSPKPIAIPFQGGFANDDKDDWDVEPVSNRQLEWGDPILSRPQNSQSSDHRSTLDSEQIYPNRRTQTIESEPPEIRRQVYDADFRLIQPPYQESVETEYADDRDSADFEYTEIDESEDFDPPSSFAKSLSPDRTTASQNLDDDDWGFDFEDLDPPRKAK